MATHAVAALLRRTLARIPREGREWLARQVMTGRYDPASRAMAHFCTQAIHAWKNRQYALDENGELALLIAALCCPPLRLASS